MEIINSLDYDSENWGECLQNLISSNGDIPLDIEEVDKIQHSIIKSINTYINSSLTCAKCLLVLDQILPQLSKDILSKYCLLWMSKATDILESDRSIPQEISISCKVLGQLIIRSKDIPDIQKQISMQNVKQLINVISNLRIERRCGPVYYVIAVLLNKYPEVCERLQTSIRKIILSQIDSTQENLINASAKCYTLLARVTERSFKPPVSKPSYTGWTYHQALICNSLHVIMDELFSSLMELENVSIWDKLEVPDISEEDVITLCSKQSQRFLNLCSYLSHMLRGFDKKNSVFPHEILKVVCRGLTVQPSNLKNRNTVRELILYLILPKLHIALFDVLDALIVGFKEQLITFGSTILQLFLQTLQWTENITEDQITISGKKPYINLRICVYKSLNSWLTNTNGLSGIETAADEYLPCILKDITPERDRVLLTIQKTQNLSKRALKRLRDRQYEKGTYLNNGIASNKEHYLDADVCKVALDTLQNIFFNSGTLLKRVFYETVQNVIIPLLYDCYLSSNEEKFYKENPDCRLLLFRVLRALQMNPHSSIPSPTQYSLEIFEMALNDNNLHITQEAKVAVAELEKIVHPRAPPLQLTQGEMVQKEFVTNGQTMQEHIEAVEEEVSTNVETTANANPGLSLSKRARVANSHSIESFEVQCSATTEILANEDIELSNKRLKVTNSDESIESCMKSISKEVSQKANEASQQEHINTATEVSVEHIQNTDIIRNEQSIQTCEESMNKEDSVPVTMDIEVIQEPESTKNSNKEDVNDSEDTLLKLFQDIPKDNH
ncbi:proline-, glutamic acid- and leucine-rich protein 1-like [Ceratina calcarata]|uniref:Proline-, glutamic acid- and leucine-rich protein 1-like n=1 Tax=Ceratina calcarata TaxID=156304 RepID=A0AAJ7JI91_9HYME|nr:proline-, glutamic acid- and leucine-rich protein 1-like [Ceratina calcarata]